VQNIEWTRLAVGDGRYFLFSPLFGRAYLVDRDATSAYAWAFRLRRSGFRARLSDPACGVALVGAAAPVIIPGRLLQVLYRFLHRSRSVMPIGCAVRIVRWLAWLRPVRDGNTLADIGATVCSVERVAGFSDCYPRAVLTAYLCLRAGRVSSDGRTAGPIR
jgi:hypothetical protein